MSTTHEIRQHLRKLDLQDIFTTRDLLNYGKRNAVDQALYRMVEKGIIVRLARGVFIQNHENLVIPSAMKVAEAKAKAFFKELYVTGENAARKIGLIKKAEEKSQVGDERKSEERERCITFNTNGSSSSFKYLKNTTIKLEHICTRKLEYKDRPVGLVIRALWFLGEDGVKNLEPALMNRAMSYMSRDDREIFRSSGAIKPHWMVSYFIRLREMIMSKSRYSTS